MKWISVKDRKPKKYGLYIVGTDYGGVDLCMWDNEERQFWIDDDNDNCRIEDESDIIYWMSLPKIP